MARDAELTMRRILQILSGAALLALPCAPASLRAQPYGMVIPPVAGHAGQVLWTDGRHLYWAPLPAGTGSGSGSGTGGSTTPSNAIVDNSGNAITDNSGNAITDS